jgi:hypothetical protein
MHGEFLLEGNVAAESHLENLFFNFQISPGAIKEVLFSVIAYLFNKEI